MLHHQMVGWKPTFYKTVIPCAVPEKSILFSCHGQYREGVVENNVVIVLKLPPHSADLLQPINLAVYRSLKSRWDSELADNQRKHVGVRIPNKMFYFLRVQCGKTQISGFCEGRISLTALNIIQKSYKDMKNV